MRARPDLLRGVLLPMLRDRSSSKAEWLAPLLMSATQALLCLRPAGAGPAAAGGGLEAGAGPSGAPAEEAVQGSLAERPAGAAAVGGPASAPEEEGMSPQEWDSALRELVQAMLPWALSHVHWVRRAPALSSRHAAALLRLSLSSACRPPAARSSSSTCAS